MERIRRPEAPRKVFHVFSSARCLSLSSEGDARARLRTTLTFHFRLHLTLRFPTLYRVLCLSGVCTHRPILRPLLLRNASHDQRWSYVTPYSV